jgi:AraC family transcriptional regulator, regulatory protein of adaptative response / methylated-DNA-[protein]-cysteine methyltransferase
VSPVSAILCRLAAVPEVSIMSSKVSSAPMLTEQDPRWMRVKIRDKSADGLFWYSVDSTGIFCRPSCPSRTANPRNVRFHPSPAAARAAGFRACKRCKPEGASVDAQNATLVAKACRLIESRSEPISLSELASAIELSPHYFHRLFKAQIGLTPKEYALAHRTTRVRKSLESSSSITQAIYDAGYNSNGRFYENAAGILGMTPKQFRSGGRDEEIHFAVGQCSLGAILVASSKKGVVSILFDDEPDALVCMLQDRFPNAHLIGADENYEQLVASVVGLVESPGANADLPLDVRGTVFQRKVWQALRKIPAGNTASYAEIARRIGAPRAVRAVAGACAANNLAVAIPCHRVVRNDGSVSGYRWGVERKRALLEREAAQYLPHVAS